MNRLAPALVTVCTLTLFPAAAAHADTLLLADFEGMAIDQPVGTGGPVLGEPVSSTNCVSTIRHAPFTPLCLEIDDETDFGSGGVIFEFLENAAVTEGTLDISVRLWFAELESYYFSVREHDGASDSFNTITFQSNGDISTNDEAGYLGTIGTYETGRAQELRIIHNLDAGTYDIWWEGSPIVQDRAHGIVGSDIGRVYTGIGHDSNLDGLMYMDDLLVVSSPPTGNEAQAWSDVKASWR